MGNRVWFVDPLDMCFCRGKSGGDRRAASRLDSDEDWKVLTKMMAAAEHLYEHNSKLKARKVEDPLGQVLPKKRPEERLKMRDPW